MSTKVATAIAQGSSNEVAGVLTTAVKRQFGSEVPQLVMVFASTKQPLTELVPLIAREFEGAVLLGCSSAGEFVESGDKDGSASIFAVSGDFKIHAEMGTGLRKDVENAVVSTITALPQEVPGYEHVTAILLLDGLFGGGEEATLITAAMLGGSVPIAGGAAADDLNMKQTFVACGDRVEEDAIVIAKVFSKVPLGVGVAHGHVPLSKPLRVTKADGNVVQEIEGRPAWDVWVEETRERTSKAGIDPEKLEGGDAIYYLGLYEGGLVVGEEFKVRVPLTRGPEGSLVFACGIPTGTVLHIMESDGDRQLKSAHKAASRAIEKIGPGNAAGAVVFDCTCRKLLLGSNFGDAVTIIAKELDAPIAGFEAYGEIALNLGDLSGYHNTTTVVLAFPK